MAPDAEGRGNALPGSISKRALPSPRVRYTWTDPNKDRTHTIYSLRRITHYLRAPKPSLSTMICARVLTMEIAYAAASYCSRCAERMMAISFAA